MAHNGYGHDTGVHCSVTAVDAGLMRHKSGLPFSRKVVAADNIVKAPGMASVNELFARLLFQNVRD